MKTQTTYVHLTVCDCVSNTGTNDWQHGYGIKSKLCRFLNG